MSPRTTPTPQAVILLKTRVISASPSKAKGTSAAGPADDETTGENPSTKQVAEAAGVVLVTGGVALAVWKVAHDFTRDTLEEVLAEIDPNAPDAPALIKAATVKTLQTHGAVKIGGGAGIGIAGAIWMKPGFGQALTTGAGVGLIVSGGEDLLEANAVEEEDITVVMARMR